MAEPGKIGTKAKVAGGSAAAIAAAGILAGVLWPQQEGTALVAYQDSIGVWTICQGDTHNVRPGLVETPAGCEARLRAIVGASIAAVDELVPGEKTVGQYIAYGDFIGNAGKENFRTSSMRRYAMQGRLRESCDALRLWVYAGGRDCRDPKSNCRGIVYRRETERAYCLGTIGP
jgi:lysozyme